MSKNPDDFQVNTSGISAMLTGLSDRFTEETTGQAANDGTTARRHDGMTAPTPKPPATPKPSKYTLLLDQNDALALDYLALSLRRRTGRAVDKSEILRALIRLADSTDAVNDALGNALDHRTRP
ncbi:hypothetical protein [Streptomyces nitrosporeus]|uniref:hypothetical protein n=1 Tax=Streptomyces nitrosporeus TaxID=28894 RepID=UPI00167D8C0E|nr:hypothetical protein [Streptomyces nitrosporeus]GGZ29983.1 hypothetical protein GCM10010327_70290 [Streptomyces nitrosporeus]